jgi:hypothetical protein
MSPEFEIPKPGDDIEIHYSHLPGDPTIDAPAPATSKTDSPSPNDLPKIAHLFLEIQNHIDNLPINKVADKTDLKDIVEEIKQEVMKGDRVNSSKIERWLRFLLDLSPDIFKITVNILAAPLDGLALVVRLTAQNLKDEQEPDNK